MLNKLPLLAPISTAIVLRARRSASSLGGGASVARPHIEEVALRFLELRHPLLGLLLGHPVSVAEEIDEGYLDVGGHPAGIAADVDNGASLNERPDIFLLCLYAVLDVRLRLPFETRKRALELRDALPGELLELLFVDVVLLRVATAEKQPRRTDPFPFLLDHRALLQEPPEGREAGAGGHHDHRRGRVLRRHEGRTRRTHEAFNHAADGLLCEVGGADPTVLAPARARRCVDHPDGDGALLGVDER